MWHGDASQFTLVATVVWCSGVVSLSLWLSKTFEFAEGRDLVTVYEFIRPPYIDNIAQTTNPKKEENAGSIQLKRVFSSVISFIQLRHENGNVKALKNIF